MTLVLIYNLLILDPNKKASADAEAFKVLEEFKSIVS